MARYTGPKDKISRRFGVAIYGPTKALENRPNSPGQHGKQSTRKKLSEYGKALMEKQKLRYQYGLLEKPFRRIYAEATRRKGVTGEIMLQMLELRLDNVVYRLGFANSRNAARQAVGHGHVLVNGIKVNVPSYQCRPGDEITLKEKAKSQQLATRARELTQHVPIPEWVAVEPDTNKGKVIRIPSRDEIQPIVQEQLIVELYSR
jgi:small subunit ribosomal protein S4